MIRFYRSNGAWQIWFLLGLLTTTASAADIYVSTNSTPGGATNWSTAYTNIQDALNTATNGVTIYLAGHTFALTNQLVWTATTNVTIRGGYAATNDVGLPGSNNPALWPTVITRSGAYSNRILSIINVITGTLERVTITGGYQTNDGYGGGVYIVGSTGLVMSACVITNNIIAPVSGIANGGGLCSVSSVATVSNCLVKNNIAGGIADSYGGGIFSDVNGIITLRDSIIANNQCLSGTYRRGGGVYNTAGTCRLRNCLVVGNTAAHGGFYSYGSASLENCTVAYNIGPGIYSELSSPITVTNSIVWGNVDDILGGGVTLGWSDIEDGDNNGTNGCISADPLFERLFYLATNSPCVDAGTNDASDWGLTNWTTRADGSNDSGRVNLGYHYQAGFDFSYGDFYVATNGSDGAAGTNALQPFRTLTNALIKARDGTRIHVASGAYTNGSERFPLTVANLTGVQILGTNRATTVLNAAANAAGSSNRVLTLANCANVLVSELTLTGGYQTNSASRYGGGIALWNCGGVVLSGCVISNNTIAPISGIANGGGLASYSSVVTLSNCLVKNNIARGGADTYGGGISSDENGMITLRDSIIANNQLLGGTPRGGGVYNTAGTCLMRNCLVVGNTGSAGSIYLYGTLTSLENCTVAYNIGPGIYNISGTFTVTNSIIWGNVDDIVGTVALGWSDIQDGDTGPGCISADPLFVNTNAADYRLTQGSPGINTGTNQAWMIDGKDLDGHSRIQERTVDMGAYEWMPKGMVFGFGGN